MSDLCTVEFYRWFFLSADDLRKEMEAVNMKETLEKLCGHSNSNVVKQANSVLQILANASQSSDHFFA